MHYFCRVVDASRSHFELLALFLTRETCFRTLSQHSTYIWLAVRLSTLNLNKYLFREVIKASFSRE